jgi:SOS-response transcriptional repressor LexA
MRFPASGIEFQAPGGALPEQADIHLVTDDSMIDAHIPPGALVHIDRGIKATSNDIVLVKLNGALLLRRLVRTSRFTVLHADNHHYLPVIIDRNAQLEICGVAVSVSIQLK